VANIKSQKKRNRQNKRAQERNKPVRSALKTDAKKAQGAAAEGDGSTEDFLREATRSLDRAVSKGVLHKKAAARRKSRLVRSVRQTSAEQAAGSEATEPAE